MSALSESERRLVIDELGRQLDSHADRLAPWFFDNLPEYYFRTHTLEEQVEHLRSLISGQVTREGRTVAIRNPEQTKVTYLAPGEDIDGFLGRLKDIARSHVISAAMYESFDSSLRLDDFTIEDANPALPNDEKIQHDTAEAIEEGVVRQADKDEFIAFLRRAPAQYVEKFDPIRAARHFDIERTQCRCEDVHVTLTPIENEKESRIICAMANPPRTGLLGRAVRLLVRAGLHIHRGYLDIFREDGVPVFGVLSFYVTLNGQPLYEADHVWRSIKDQLPLIKWLAPHDLQWFADHRRWNIKKVALLQAACEFAHQFLIKTNLYAFTSDNIVRSLLAHPDETDLVIQYFYSRFDPKVFKITPLGTDRSREIYDKAKAATDCIDDDVAREVLYQILHFFKFTLRTNYFLPSRYGLSFRLSSDYLADIPEKDRPYGFFFFHGPLSQGFHVRYRETSRGGVRIVPTRTQEQFEVESNRVFTEVTNLARAQQYKNKDIPEGGAKAVILLGPGGECGLAFKSMVDSLLDIILPDEDSPALPDLVDYLGQQELIYLGPDENIDPEHIVWAVERAKMRGYPYPQAFMSSKPKAGINHKQYGVTSLGVVVFAEEILRHLGIDPRSMPFTVKLTGGPAGDVAGNAVRILHNEYGENAVIVSMSDGHGAAFDPQGLDHNELLRLVSEEKSIDSFNPALLSGKEAFVVSTADPNAPNHRENVRIRNMLHNTVKADLFIPAGGRPDTINTRNWRNFLDAEGLPTARAIVEGANIFITAEARAFLQEEGVLIVHGASANKTGVICSSYEILGGLVMTEDEFLAIKDCYVTDVLDILRLRASNEAKLMLRERKAAGGNKPLTEISLALAREMNRLADSLLNTLVENTPDIANDPILSRLYTTYCPTCLVEAHKDRLFTHVPQRYIYALIAAHAASTIVYAEGVGWFDALSKLRDPFQVIRAYFEEKDKLNVLTHHLSCSDTKEAAEARRILERSGRKLLTMESLDLA
ncbi:NAD-glutamate dehydrogenase domain-containing protein [Desulfovibrio inopinatus]|uniref:NAD-glutamate dehydrogenase domain-containing protein n=1 Tax=Desulfovibrio inopinatus TaxID=102109 RepID=UPI000403C362|nr:NAD-glutamate dehydrogenase domain-containing protein [Desulfovibrio inopinatus]